MTQFFLQCLAGVGNLSQQLFIFRQQVIDIARPFVGLVRVLDIEVVVSGLDLRDGYLPGDFILFAPLALGAAPPGLFGLEFLDADRPGLVIGLGAFGQLVLVIPYFLSRLALFEEQQIGGNAGSLSWC